MAAAMDSVRVAMVSNYVGKYSSLWQLLQVVYVQLGSLIMFGEYSSPWRLLQVLYVQLWFLIMSLSTLHYAIYYRHCVAMISECAWEYSSLYVAATISTVQVRSLSVLMNPFTIAAICTVQLRSLIMLVSTLHDGSYFRYCIAMVPECAVEYSSLQLLLQALYSCGLCDNEYPSLQQLQVLYSSDYVGEHSSL